MAIGPGTHDMTIQRRADHIVPMAFKDSGGNAISLNGYTLISQVWDSSRSSKAADVTIAYTNQAGGTFDWTLTDTQTATMTAGEYEYDILVTNPAGLKEYWLEGTIFMDEGFSA
tara:strand:- start:5512 stop:5853 length:342 start_codon:yes stop_codon:yes gene_type:complete